MTKGMGYPLPPGDASEDELECCIVFYPKRDAYRRALMGSLDYLATWIAWERDSEKRGQDAAASWKLANIQTWECTNMGYCDDLATTLDALLAATQALECCGPQDITDGLQFTDEIVDGVGDVPQNIIDAGYATDASDWAGFDDYKCMISHLAVDHIETFFRDIAPHINTAELVVGGVGVVGALLGAILAVVGLPISAAIIVALGAAAAIYVWIAEYGKDAVVDLADEIAANHDALACAIYGGDGVSDAIDDFNDEVDSLFGTIDAAGIKAVGFEPQLRAMYSGRYDQEDIAAKLEELGYETVGYNCDCVVYDPPPSGYHLRYPTLVDSYSGAEGSSNNGSSYNPTTGILVLNFSDDGDEIEFQANFEFTGNDFSYHGWVVDLIAKDIPASVQMVLPSNMSPTKGSNKIHTSIPDAWWDPGQSLSGFNVNQHGGSSWNDWADQWENVVHSNVSFNILKFFETPNGTAVSGDYSVTLRVQYLVPD